MPEGQTIQFIQTNQQQNIDKYKNNLLNTTHRRHHRWLVKLVFVYICIDMTPERTCSNDAVQTNLVYDKYGIDRIFNVEVNGR
jgi:hypothetical protein